MAGIPSGHRFPAPGGRPHPVVPTPPGATPIPRLRDHAPYTKPASPRARLPSPLGRATTRRHPRPAALLPPDLLHAGGREAVRRPSTPARDCSSAAQRPSVATDRVARRPSGPAPGHLRRPDCPGRPTAPRGRPPPRRPPPSRPVRATSGAHDLVRDAGRRTPDAGRRHDRRLWSGTSAWRTPDSTTGDHVSPTGRAGSRTGSPAPVRHLRHPRVHPPTCAPLRRGPPPRPTRLDRPGRRRTREGDAHPRGGPHSRIPVPPTPAARLPRTAPTPLPRPPQRRHARTPRRPRCDCGDESPGTRMVRRLPRRITQGQIVERESVR